LNINKAPSVSFAPRPSPFALHQAPVYALSEGIHSEQIFTGGGDRIVALWDLESGNQLPFSVRTDAPIYSLFFYVPTQMLFVGCSNGKLHAIDLLSKQEKQAWSLDAKGVFDLKWDISQNRLLVAGGSGILTVLDLSELKVVRSVPLSDGKLRRVAIHKAGHLLAVADNSGPVHVLDADTFQTIETIHSHTDGASAVAWHPSKPVLVSGGKDAFIRCHSIGDEFRQILSFAAHQSTIYDIVYHDNVSCFVSCSRDKTVKWWDPLTFDPLHRVGHAEGGHKHSVNRLLTAGSHLITAGDDRQVLVFGA
jgi:WD repeat-containing protein 61